MIKNLLKNNKISAAVVVAVLVCAYVLAAGASAPRAHAVQNDVTIGQTVTGTPVDNTPPSTGGGGGSVGGGTGYIFPPVQPVVVPVAVATAPENISHFSAVASGEQINLSWQNPQTTFDAVRIVRSDKFYPRDPLDGKIMFEGSATRFSDTDVVAGSKYYYTAFTVRGAEYSSGAITSAAVSDVFGTIPELSPAVVNNILLARFSAAKIIFSQEGKTLPMNGDSVTVKADQSLKISVPYETMPEILKSIVMTVYTNDNRSNSFSFLLRVNANKTAYEAVLAPLEQAGTFAFGLAVLDYKNQGLKKVNGTIVSEFPPASSGTVSQKNLLSFLHALKPVHVFYSLLVIALIALVARVCVIFLLP